MAIGKCLKCDTVTEMTEDHVFPKWFRKLIANIGLTQATGITSGIELVCKKCNSEKGGKVNFAHENSRGIVKKIIEHWLVEIRKHETYNP